MSFHFAVQILQHKSIYFVCKQNKIDTYKSLSIICFTVQILPLKLIFLHWKPDYEQ